MTSVPDAVGEVTPTLTALLTVAARAGAEVSVFRERGFLTIDMTAPDSELAEALDTLLEHVGPPSVFRFSWVKVAPREPVPSGGGS